VRLDAARDRLGQRGLALLVVLEQPEDQPGADPLELTPDVQPAAVEVEVIRIEAEDLTLPRAAARADVEDRPVPGRQAGPDRGDLEDLPGHHLLLGRLRLLHGLHRARVLGDPLVVHGRRQDGPQMGEQHRARRRGQLADHALSHSRTVPGLMADSCRAPKYGSRCLRTRISVDSRLDSSKLCVRSQVSANSAKVIRPAAGSM
jgi:hypothetical protein